MDFLSEKTDRHTRICCAARIAAPRREDAECQRLFASHICRTLALVVAGVEIGARSPDIATALLVLLTAATYVMSVGWSPSRLQPRVPGAHTQGCTRRVHVSPLAALHGLLRSMFSETELRRFIRDGESGEVICANLPGERAPMAELVDGVIAQLQRRGLVSLALTRLRQDFPWRLADIEEVANLWIEPPNPA